MLQVFTSTIDYPGTHRLNVTRKSGMLAFAPSPSLIRAASRKLGGNMTWEDYVLAYTEEMRASFRSNRSDWETLLGCKRVVLVCYCLDPRRCHRSILAGILGKCGAKVFGEISEWDETTEDAVTRRELQHDP
jgi:uncharacterized protein YeaO (DUF488 family)